jgi:hypothetical protein
MSPGTRIELVCLSAGSAVPYRTHRCLVPANPRDAWISDPADVNVVRSEREEYLLFRVQEHPPDWEPDG